MPYATGGTWSRSITTVPSPLWSDNVRTACENERWRFVFLLTVSQCRPWTPPVPVTATVDVVA
jgi:hypothetical protein